MKPIKNNLTDILNIDYPIIQAPMGWIARSQLASAVSEAGGLGIIETSSGELDVIRDEIKLMREKTKKPFGVNIAQAFVRDPDIVNFIIDQGVKFVTTSAGDPNKYCSELKEAGLTVFHVVPSISAALKAIEAGVDGLVVEGFEGGGFIDGKTMAAAFSLGAQGIQMGTRMVSSKESPVHENWKNAIMSADDQSTVLLNRFSSPALRALRTDKTNKLEKNDDVNAMQEFGTALDLYFGGDMESSIALTGQVAGRIEKEKPVKDIINETINEFYATIEKFGNLS